MGLDRRGRARGAEEEGPVAAAASIQVMIVEDHFALSESLGLAIDFETDMECVGLAPTIGEALELMARCAPDVVLMDVLLPDGDGIDATARLKAICPQAAVLVLTAHPDPALMVRAAEAGASGFLRKESRVAEVLRAIRLAAGGALALEVGSLRNLLATLREGPPPARARPLPLTAREQEVLTLMSAGLGPKAIATRLGMTVHTCRSHVKSILGKLGAHTQLEAVVVAARHQLLPDP